MGLFGSKRQRDQPPTRMSEQGSRPGPMLGPGRRLRSTNDISTAVNTLDAMVGSYRTSPYRGMPLLSFPGFFWQGDGPGPDIVASFDGEDETPIFVALWRTPTGTDAGLFPLGAGDHQLMRPEVGRWVMAGGKLSSIGTISGALLGLSAPVLGSDYFKHFLEAGGFPLTDKNLKRLEDHVAEQFLIKASQFVGRNGNQIGARQFVDQWSTASPQAILDALAEDSEVVPYMCDFPGRIRGLSLAFLSGEVGNRPGGEGTFWDHMER